MWGHPLASKPIPATQREAELARYLTWVVQEELRHFGLVGAQGEALVGCCDFGGPSSRAGKRRQSSNQSAALREPSQGSTDSADFLSPVFLSGSIAGPLRRLSKSLFDF